MKIFLSYSHQDKVFCQRLASRLRQALRNIDLFIDVDGLHGGDKWLTVIQREILEREVFIVILSSASVTSSWVRQETELALQEAASDPRRVILPVMYQQCDIDALAPFLRARQYITCEADNEEKCIDTVVDTLRTRHSGLTVSLEMGNEHMPARPPQDTKTSLPINVASIDYFNVPRVLMDPKSGDLFARQLDPALAFVQSLHGLGGNLGSVLVAIRRFLQEWQPHTVPFHPNLDQRGVGQYVAIEAVLFKGRQFPLAAIEEGRSVPLRGDLKKDPVLYCTLGKRRVYLPIDPRWITTSTAITHLSGRHGEALLSGIAMLRYAAPTELRLTPLVLGSPRQPYADYFGLL